VVAAAPPGPVDRGEDADRGGPLVSVGHIDFDDALDTIKEAAEQLGQRLLTLPSAPTSAEITFGVQLSTQVGAFIAKVDGTANFAIKLSWSRK
jgi:hypothetical protein